MPAKFDEIRICGMRHRSRFGCRITVLRTFARQNGKNGAALDRTGVIVYIAGTPPR